MPDFSPTEISLARQLALPREFREGDWFTGTFREGDWFTGTVDNAYLVQGPRSRRKGAARRPQEPYSFWLPSVEDCFGLLREAGCDGKFSTLLEYSSHPDAIAPWSASAWLGETGEDFLPPATSHFSGHGATPREALYRLLLAVREAPHA